MNKSSDSEGLEASPSTVSPLGKSRYGRTRKPKISDDFCNIDDLFSDTAPQSQQKNVKTLLLSPISTKSLEIDSLFMPKQIQPLPKQAVTVQRATPPADLPKLVSVPLRERKFFKSNADVDIGDVSVSEVLKIIKSDALESPPKPTVKPILRTYGNKRKLMSKGDVVESFALPDNPIVPLESSKNDVPVKFNVDLPASTPLPINNIDVQTNDVNNCTLNLNYSVVFDEMQMKAEECIVKSTSVKKTNEEIDIRTKKQEDTKMAVVVNGKRKKLTLKEPLESLQPSKKSKILHSDSNVKQNQKSSDTDTNTKTNGAQRGVALQQNQVVEKQKKQHPAKLDVIQKNIAINVDLKTQQKLDATLVTQIKQEESPVKHNKKTKSLGNKTEEIVEVNSVERKKSKRKNYRTGEVFVSPRTLRSSVIYVEAKPAEIIDLTVGDDNEKQEKTGEIDRNECVKNSNAVAIKRESQETPDENYCDVKIKQEKIDSIESNG